MKAITLATQNIMLGQRDIMVAGGEFKPVVCCVNHLILGPIAQVWRACRIFRK
jgi:hypothetical protein